MPPAFSPITPAVALLAISVVATGWMTWTAWAQRRRRHVMSLAVLNALAFAWTLTALLYHLLDASGPRHVLLDVRYVPIVIIPVAWFVFSWAASGLPRLSLRSVALLSVVPTMTLFLLATNSMHGLLFSGMYEVPNRWAVAVGHDFGPWFWVHASYSYSLFVAGAGLMGMMWKRTNPVLRPKVALLLIGAIAPALINVLYLTNQAFFGFIDLSPVGFAVSTLCYGVGVFRFRILEMTPVPTGRLIESLDEARVVLTPTGRILDINSAAELLFETKASDLVGCHASGPIRALWHKRGEHGVIEDVEIAGLSAEGWYEMVLSPVRNGDSDQESPACWLLRLREVGKRKARQAELEAQLALVTGQSQKQTAALKALHQDLTPRLAGIRGLAGVVADEATGEAAGFSRLIEDAATVMEATLIRQLGLAEALSTDSGSELQRRPSRAPVPRSAGDPHASGTPAEGLTP